MVRTLRLHPVCRREAKREDHRRQHHHPRQLGDRAELARLLTVLEGCGDNLRDFVDRCPRPQAEAVRIENATPALARAGVPTRL